MPLGIVQVVLLPPPSPTLARHKTGHRHHLGITVLGEKPYLDRETKEEKKMDKWTNGHENGHSNDMPMDMQMDMRMEVPRKLNLI